MDLELIKEYYNVKEYDKFFELLGFIESDPKQNFEDEFYTKCNRQRFLLIIDKYGFDYFQGKTLLELGGAIGTLSNAFYKLGCIPTVYEGRLENINYGKIKYPHITFLQANLETNPRPTNDKFDIVLNFGLFYHLNNPIENLQSSFDMANDLLILDGNVSVEETVIHENPDHYDKSMSGLVNLITDSHILNTFKDIAIKTEKIDQELDDIAKSITGSPYSYTRAEADCISPHYRTFWFISKK